MSVSYFKTAAQSSFTASPVTVGPIEWIAPFEGETARVYFRQQYQQAIDTWTALALDTAHPSATTYLLVRESDFQQIGGGQHRWYRYFACTPPQRVEYSSYSAQFPGLYEKRDPVNATTQAQITLDYFFVPTPGATPSLAQESRATDANGLDTPLLSGVYLNNGGGILFVTTPSATAYQSSITTDQATPSSYSITAEPQSLSRWIGNFYVRTTLKVKAK